ncbi:alpha-ketoacid dehydrogenase subunit beta [Oceaniserpentilla sp. 4NH20-0058]|uniref:alpha-ketoacid dehydrogenase subunit beta n=1 Tax=Oceaniserpentilla sp. 4NH20-0058 TaxID=3127660 RepID=UPI0031057EE5
MSVANNMNQSKPVDSVLLEAVNLALHYEMDHDESVVVLGEDVGTNGGVFRATTGLKEKFGFKRVMDTPLAEALISGMTVGMASQGLKPVAEIQFMGFIFPAFEHLFCHAARLRNRTRGRMSCPMVLRAPYGGGIHAPEHHSESTEALIAHTPGIRVVIPSSPARAYGLLLAAIRNPDPVVFLEPKRIYRGSKQTINNNGEALPLDTCFTLRQGTDVSLISWGACIADTLEAADKLAEKGISAEVIDVATIKPLDMRTIIASVVSTGRCVIVHEAARSFGVGAEIAAQISEKCFLNLLSPVQRVTGFDTHMPYFKNEHYYLPNSNDIVAAVDKCFKE